MKKPTKKWNIRLWFASTHFESTEGLTRLVQLCSCLEEDESTPKELREWFISGVDELLEGNNSFDEILEIKRKTGRPRKKLSEMDEQYSIAREVFNLWSNRRSSNKILTQQAACDRVAKNRKISPVKVRKIFESLRKDIENFNRLEEITSSILAKHRKSS